jgi:hypothetical protein
MFNDWISIVGLIVGVWAISWLIDRFKQTSMGYNRYVKNEDGKSGKLVKIKISEMTAKEMWDTFKYGVFSVFWFIILMFVFWLLSGGSGSFVPWQVF